MLPKLKEDTLFNPSDEEDEKEYPKFYSVECGNCGELFGVTEDASFTSFKQHYNFCNRCGMSVHWL